MIDPPPINDTLADSNNMATLRWILFFNNIYNGDAGTDWTPTFQNLTTVGTPTITGRYYKLSQYLTYFRVIVTPATSTTSTAGSTYIDNFPLRFNADGACLAMRGGEGTQSGHIVASTNRIYTPPWVTVTVPMVIVGLVEAS